jgi:hypothetical protein
MTVRDPDPQVVDFLNPRNNAMGALALRLIVLEAAALNQMRKSVVASRSHPGRSHR